MHTDWSVGYIHNMQANTVDTRGMSKEDLEKTMREKDRIISLKDEEISAMKAKMEDMAREFGGMLKETLDKMRERIELSSTNLDMEGPLIPPAHDIGEYGA